MTISRITFDIRELIPQREPILMVDRLLEADAERAVTSFTVRDGLVFQETPEDVAGDRKARPYIDGTQAVGAGRVPARLGAPTMLTEVGLIENIAQSASALAGYKAKLKGLENPPVGYIGEIKNFCLYENPRVGDELQTVVTFGPEVGGVTLIEGEVRVGDRLMARTRMKIFVE